MRYLFLLLLLFAACDGDLENHQYKTVLIPKEFTMIDAYYVSDHRGHGLYYYKVLYKKDTLEFVANYNGGLYRLK